MKAITKKNEPMSLTQHRANQHSSFENLDKTDVRVSLLDEQGHICCYCMKRIPEKNTNPSSKIEHYLCQKKHPNEELNYNNMLLACSGQQGSPKRLQTCDTNKGNLSLSFNPTNNALNIENLIRYKANGEITSKNEILKNELDKVLNLNVKNLVDNRKIIFEEVQNKIIAEHKRLGKKPLSKRFLKNEKTKWLNMNDRKYSEFCMVGIYVIDKKLSKMN